MPINIYEHQESKNKQIENICADIWDLPSQLNELEKWLINNEANLRESSYVADIGFNIRPDACGGGGVVTLKTMSLMVKVGMELFLSEYPCDEKGPN